MSDTDLERTIWPTYALRAWLGALVAHVRRSRHDLESRIEAAEKDVARLRRQHERAGEVIGSLEESIGRVDARLRQMRDTEPRRPHEPQGGQPSGAGEREHGAPDDRDKEKGPEPRPGRGPGRPR